MAMAGRKPKPTALKVLEGDRGKGRRSLNEHEPVPPRGGVKCPSWLLPEAKKEWKRLAASLEAMGVLTMADLTAFAGYCQAYARWREAEDFITQHGAAGIHCPAESENHAVLRHGIRSDPSLSHPHCRQRRRSRERR